jgi:hypothetical protein
VYPARIPESHYRYRGGNTKGGYVDVRNNDVFCVFSTSCSYGTITLTEAVIKITTTKEDLSEFKEKSFSFYLF